MRYALIMVMFLLLSGCSATLPASPATPREASRWFVAAKQQPRGVFLIVHGLNLRPSAMDPLAEELAAHGYHVHRITLRGHNGRTTQIFDEKVWVREVAQSYHEIRARFPDLPTYVLGYSLGGLTLVTMLESIPPSDYPRAMVLLAPAISLRGPLDVLTTLRLPPPISWAFPSLAPQEYRRYDYTPLFWYSNTLALYREVDNLAQIERLAAIPTLVALNESDEIVSPDGTAQWIEDHHLAPAWQIEMVTTKNSEFPFKEHLVIDEASLGQAEWNRLREGILSFLKSI